MQGHGLLEFVFSVSLIVLVMLLYVKCWNDPWWSVTENHQYYVYLWFSIAINFEVAELVQVARAEIRRTFNVTEDYR